MKSLMYVLSIFVSLLVFSKSVAMELEKFFEYKPLQAYMDLKLVRTTNQGR